MNNPNVTRFCRTTMTTAVVVIVYFLLMPTADASTGGNTGFFGPLWDFIDWIYELWTDFTNWILSILIELILYFELLYIKLKISMIELTWSIVFPVIQSLDLSNTLSSAFGDLAPTVQSFATTFRIGEAVNILASAKLTKMVLSWF